MTETSTTALARSTWTCTSCGRGWKSLWTRPDTLRDTRRWLRETPWWMLPHLAAFGPLMLIIMLAKGPRCPLCQGKCVR